MPFLLFVTARIEGPTEPSAMKQNRVQSLQAIPRSYSTGRVGPLLGVSMVLHEFPGDTGILGI